MRAHGHTRYTSAYFDRQQTESDVKIAGQCDRMLWFTGGRPAFIMTHVLAVGCGAAPGLRFLHALRSARDLLPDARLMNCDLDQSRLLTSRHFDIGADERGRRACDRFASCASRDLAGLVVW